MRSALERGASALPGRTAVGRIHTSRTALAPLVLAGCALVAVAGRFVFADGFVTPWILVDELIHAELAESFIEGDGFRVRGEGMTVTFLYPFLVAPAWIADSMQTTYGAAKLINCVVMTLAVVPLYLWGRRFLSPVGAAVAAGLALVLPAFVLTGTLMQENVAFPTFLLAAFALAVALERPTPLHQGLALAAIALAATARVQSLILLPIFAVAVVARRDVIRYRLSAALVVGAGLAYAAVRAVQGEPPLESLGVYGGIRDPDYSVADLARWLWYGFGELSLAIGLVPMCALFILLSRRVRRDASPAERSFLAVTATSLALLLVLVAAAGEWTPEGIKERYLLYVEPLLLLALVLWIERGVPRPRVPTIAGLVLPGLAVVSLPLDDLFAAPSFLGNAFGLFPVWRLSLTVPGGTDTATAAVLGGALVASALVLFLPRRAGFVLVGLVATYLAVSSVPVYTTLTQQSERVRDVAALGDERWLDAAVGKDADVLFLNTSAFHPDTALGRWFETWVPVWQTEFWNRSATTVHSLGAPEPGPFRQTHGRLDWATGRVESAPAARYVVSDPRFALVGARVRRTRHLVLYDARPPLRLAAATEGVYRDGTTGTLAAYDRWVETQAVEVEVSGAVARSAAVVLTGRLGVGRTGEPHISGFFVPARARVVPGRVTRIRVAVPPPPFRVELRLGAGARGAAVRFRPIPSA